MIDFSFSKIFLKVDFFSRFLEFKIIFISFGFFSIKSSTVSLILSVALLMIMSFSLSKKDFVKTELKKLSRQNLQI